MIWHVSMIGLGQYDNRWGVVLDYNDIFLLAIYVVLMLYYAYIIAIYDGVCVRDMLNILFWDVFLTFMKTWLTGCGSAWRWI